MSEEQGLGKEVAELVGNRKEEGLGKEVAELVGNQRGQLVGKLIRENGSDAQKESDALDPQSHPHQQQLMQPQLLHSQSHEQRLLHAHLLEHSHQQPYQVRYPHRSYRVGRPEKP